MGGNGGASDDRLRGSRLSASPEGQERADSVLLSAPDEVADAIEQALKGRDRPVTVERLLPAALFEREPATLYIVTSDIDESGGVDTLRRLSARSMTAARVVVLFKDPADRRRSIVSAVGGYDYVLSPDGDLSPLVALVDRVLARNSLEARLDSAMRQVRALVENSTDGVYILREGRFLYVNPRFEQMVGYSAAELLAEEFDLDAIIAPESRRNIAERGRRVEQGLPVEPRYEFLALQHGGGTFDAQVSVSYIDFDGKPATLGIMQDITERKRFEQQLVRKNRELALLNELAASINSAVDLDETLLVGTRRVSELLGFAAAGITLLTPDRRFLALRVSEGLDGALADALGNLSADSSSLLAYAVRTGDVEVVADIHNDPRVAVGEVKHARFTGCTVVPLKARDRNLGGAFFFTREGHVPSESDRDLMLSIGMLLGTAIEKAALLEKERAAVHRMKAIDDIALVIASSLDVDEVAEAVARSVRAVFGPEQVMIARHILEEDIFVPLCTLEGESLSVHRPLSRDETLMGLAFLGRGPVQRLSPKSRWRGHDDEAVVPPWEERLFERGFGAAVAVPVISDGSSVAALHLAWRSDAPVAPDDLDALMTLSTHLAIAMKNAELFAARNRALSELKAAQEKLVQAERLNALGELAAGVAHDFNNVLGAILGRAQILARTLEEPELKKHAEVIETAAEDGAETVRRIQEIGRNESTDDFVPVELNGILQDVAEITMPRWHDRTREEGRPVELLVEPWSHGDPVVSGNPHELREVLINLVHNAVDAMPSGGSIHLSSAITGGGEGDLCEIRVKDAGTGMPDDVKSRIFDPFFTTKGDKGTGLGLSVSYSIIKRHGGDVEVHSTLSGPERGTAFVITLPRLPLDKELPEAAAPVRVNGTATRGRVLVIDDEENIRDILTDILLTGDHEVTTAVDGPEGLARLEQGDFDLVFTDLGLPGMSGYEVAAQIKARKPDVPVGLVTGWGATLDPEKAKQHGVDIVLSKPFRFDQVLRLVDEALEKRGRS